LIISVRLARSQEDFEAAAERISNTPGPNNDEMLELYALFKQAKFGDNDTRKHGSFCCIDAATWEPTATATVQLLTAGVVYLSAAKPGLLDLKGKKKWESWNSKKGESTPRFNQAELAAGGTAVRWLSLAVAACQFPEDATALRVFDNNCIETN
jgi:acyl-CoA-binding protein